MGWDVWLVQFIGKGIESEMERFLVAMRNDLVMIAYDVSVS